MRGARLSTLAPRRRDRIVPLCTMNPPPANLMVLVGEHFACVKISGRANFNVSVTFKTLLTELWQKGFSCFVIELSECLLMDSTFLGVLAGFGLKMSQADDHSPPHLVELRNPNARITELLENLGVLHCNSQLSNGIVILILKMNG